MRILVNATTCVVGGGIQVAGAFIRHAIRDSGEHQFRFALSQPLANDLGRELEPGGDRVVTVSPSPARFRAGRASRRELLRMEAAFQPDVVFTVFGPAYVRFAAPHVCGFAVAWVTHASPIALRALPPLLRLRNRLLCRYKACRLSPRDAYWVESSVARKGLARRIGVPEDHIRVVPNAYSDHFASPPAHPECNPATVRILALASPYRHKNLPIIPAVAARLREHAPKTHFNFVVTLPEAGPDVKRFWAEVSRHGVEDAIENVGRVAPSACPALYADADLVFLPTLLETFSATYPEAMQCGCPVVTTDLDFARDICGPAAEYFDALSPVAAAKAILRVATDERRYRTLVDAGRQRVQNLPTPEEKYRLLLDWIQQAPDLLSCR